MGPEELDDLLNNTGAESKRESALALYEGTRETDLVDEEIDERVLGLLGLEDVFDIDYGTYITLLKERLAASRNFEKKLSSEEDELLVSEFRRVKGKVGRFKLKKRKVTSEDIGVTGPIRVSSSKFLLAGKAVIPEREATESSSDILDIQKALDDILKTLTLQNKDKKKSSEDERKKSEDSKRRTREGELEKPLTQLKALAKKIIAPAQGILDRIFRFIKFTLLGHVFNQLIDWFNDPKNADKVKVLSRFLKDWWPSLLFAYGLFATPFGKFVRGTLRMLRGFIPQMARFMAANPWLTLYTAATIGAVAKIKESERMKPLTQKSQQEIDKTLESKETPWYQKLGASFANQNLNAPGGPKNPIGLPTPAAMYSGGGRVKRMSLFGQKEVNARDLAFDGGGGISEDSGVKIKGAGVDTQLIAARPGEVVISKEAVDKYGANFFLNLNKKGGGTNVPRMVNNIQLASGGGLIKKTIKSYQGGGMIGGETSLLNRVLPKYKGSGGTMSNASGGMSGGGMSIRNYQPIQNTSNYFKSNQPIQNTSNYFKSNQPSNSNSVKNSRVAGNLSNSTSIMNAVKNVSDYNLSLKGSVPTSQRFGSESKKYYSPQSIASIPSSSVMNYVMNAESSPNIQPISISPQSQPRSIAPGPPVIYTKTTYNVLPAVKSQGKQASIPRGSTLPAFRISSDNDCRSKIASALGITDLVGVV